MPPLDFLKVPLLARLLKPVTGLATSDARLLDQSAVDLPMDPTIVENVGSCAGFRTPGMTSHPRAHSAGVRKAPRQEIAEGGVLAVQRALWGFGRDVRVEGVGPKPSARSAFLKAWVWVEG